MGRKNEQSVAPTPRTRRRFLRLIARAIGFFFLFFLILWCLGAVWYSNLGPDIARAAAAILFVIAIPVMWIRCGRRKAIVACLAIAAVIIVAWQFKRPSDDRTWTDDVARTVEVTFEGDLVHIKNVRNCFYRSKNDFDIEWEDHTYNLNEIESLDYMVELLGGRAAVAHTMLTFGFEGGRHLAISVELRREPGEAFHPVPGIYRQFELIYIVGTEEDLLRLRTNHRKDIVYLFPIDAAQERIRELCVAMLERADNLRTNPEFYNSLTSSCTTNIVTHVNQLSGGSVPFSYKVLLPGYSGELAYDLGMIDTDLSYEDAKERFRIDEIAQAHGDGPEFSKRVREYDSK